MSVTMEGAGQKNGIILVILASLAMIVMFVEIMLVPALPTLARDFPNDVQWISWVLSIYLLIGAVSTPVVGRLGDIYGKRRVLIAVMSMYLVALVGCGLSLDISNALFGHSSIFVLLFFRAIQGVGMGMFTLAFGIVRDTFPRERIPVAIGMISAMFSVGVSIGLIGGGYITSVAKWTDAFFIVSPFFLGLAIASYYCIRDPCITRGGGLDLPGAITLGIGVLAFLLALTQGESWGWLSAGVVSLFVVAVVSTVIFTLIEARSRDPIIRPSLLKNHGILGGNLVAVFVGLCMFLVFQTLPYFLETPIAAGGKFGLTDTLTVGLFMFPSAIAQLFCGPLGGSMSKKIGASKVLIAGMTVMAFGFVALLGLHSDFWQLALSQMILGAGMALCMVSVINVVMESCPQGEFGVASGMNTLFRIVGGSIGPVLATVILAANTIIIQVAPGIEVAFYTEHGYMLTWWLGLGFAVIGTVVAIVLRPGASDRCVIPAVDIPSSGR